MTTPIAIFRQLASGELSVTEARIALASLTPSSPSPRPQRNRKPIGKRVKVAPVEWATPVTTWDDVTERYQWALRYSPTQDPWDVFVQAR